MSENYPFDGNICPPSFDFQLRRFKRLMLLQPLIDTGMWQSMDAPQAQRTRELLGAQILYQIPETMGGIQSQVHPNLPWAEDHFQERISGLPLNPPPSNEWWPFAQKNNAEHKMGSKFSHTYPERFWPKTAGLKDWMVRGGGKNKGVRFFYGDLADVVSLLQAQPHTRQAYLPVWFPEDTGVVHGERVPCTLGYHFIRRAGLLHCFYFMRSCDMIRHLNDDVYMAARLTQWVADQLPRTGYGILQMNISSLHTFAADAYGMREDLKR